MAETIEVENVNTPGRTSRVNAAKYNAMKTATLAIMTSSPPGLTASEIKDAAKPLLPDDLFPGGATSGWWQKTVQLDLEAKGVVIRNQTKPLRFYLA